MGKRSAVEVAEDILHLAKRRGWSLTPMQVTKLVYIAYGWYLAFRAEDDQQFEDRLFEDRIEAWRFGPVIPTIYHLFKRFGRNGIPFERIPKELNYKELEGFLDGVVEQYGEYSGFALSNLTHSEGSPWKKVYEPGVLDTPIPDEVIRAHYVERLRANRAELGLRQQQEA